MSDVVTAVVIHARRNSLENVKITSGSYLLNAFCLLLNTAQLKDERIIIKALKDKYPKVFPSLEDVRIYFRGIPLQSSFPSSLDEKDKANINDAVNEKKILFHYELISEDGGKQVTEEQLQYYLNQFRKVEKGRFFAGEFERYRGALERHQGNLPLTKAGEQELLAILREKHFERKTERMKSSKERQAIDVENASNSILTLTSLAAKYKYNSAKQMSSDDWNKWINAYSKCEKMHDNQKMKGKKIDNQNVSSSCVPGTLNDIQSQIGRNVIGKGHTTDYEGWSQWKPETDVTIVHPLRRASMASQELQKNIQSDLNTVYRDLSKEECLRGNTFYKESAWEKAIRAYTNAIHLCENDVRPWNNRAQCYLKLGDFERTKKDVKTVIRLDPSNIKGHQRYAVALKNEALSKATIISADEKNRILKEAILHLEKAKRLLKNHESKLFWQVIDQLEDLKLELTK